MTGIALMVENESKTLSQRMEEGRLPAAEALHDAALLADSLRKIHDSGKVHGALTPHLLTLTAGGLELLAAPEWAEGAVTPYTAPEVLHGRPPDSRSDIFSFGAILFEMLTGRQAFEGEGRSSLINHITNAPVPSAGSPAVDRLLASCLAKNPDARTPRMQQVTMELKLLTVAARRADPLGVSAAGLRQDPMDAGDLRTEMQQLEGRIARRLQAHEKAVVELQRSTREAVVSLRGQIASLSGELAAAQLRVAVPSDEDDPGNTGGERLRQLERCLEEVRAHHAQFERSVAADLVDIEQALKFQSVATESSRTAMSQTDDLVERVVEALESIQSTVLEQTWPRG